MEILDLLNADDDGAEWVFEASDTEGDEASIGDNEDPASESEDESLETQPAADPHAGQCQTGNAYVDELIRDRGLHIVRKNEVKAAYKERWNLDLFSLSLTKEFRESLRTWTNKMVKDKSKPEATVYELDAYIRLEIAMSFNPVTEIKELWSTKMFIGQSDFASAMARNRFESIRVRFQVHAPGNVPVEHREQDHLWYSRRLMRQIQEKNRSDLSAGGGGEP
ncbi:Hypothetical protein PHPALM_17848 [Phytophthora palmivora]|uniref:PiggyBac transposable element-derived protein domain-containing protein n=1 Tax=Phytophthora palmivora TaxID=4796 RepID=A0A2P4XL62_9STRA|nr:Hypothetical protein PHPALM_17848 [Phytophthora palmivora]